MWIFVVPTVSVLRFSFAPSLSSSPVLATAVATEVKRISSLEVEYVGTSTVPWVHGYVMVVMAISPLVSPVHSSAQFVAVRLSEEKVRHFVRRILSVSRLVVVTVAIEVMGYNFETVV